MVWQKHPGIAVSSSQWSATRKKAMGLREVFRSEATDGSSDGTSNEDRGAILTQILSKILLNC
jgi:hypothetical protein